MIKVNDVEITEEQLKEAGYNVEKIETELPQRATTGYVIHGDSTLFTTELSFFDMYYENFSLYGKENLANKATKLMRRSNAIIMACLLVDPDYEPDWNNLDSDKFAPMYGLEEWVIASSRAHDACNVYVSTEAKAELVCKLLTKWGVE